MQMQDYLQDAPICRHFLETLWKPLLLQRRFSSTCLSPNLSVISQVLSHKGLFSNISIARWQTRDDTQWKVIPFHQLLKHLKRWGSKDILLQNFFVREIAYDSHPLRTINISLSVLSVFVDITTPEDSNVCYGQMRVLCRNIRLEVLKTLNLGN